MNALSRASFSASGTTKAGANSITERELTEWWNPERAMTKPSRIETVRQTSAPVLARSARLALEPCQ